MIDVKGSQNRKRNPIVRLVIECVFCFDGLSLCAVIIFPKV